MSAVVTQLSAIGPLASAAAKYCDARDREQQIMKSLKWCERKPKFTGFREEGPMYSVPEETNEGLAFCSRAVVTVPGYDEPSVSNLPEAHWCQSCRDNIPAVAELKKVRRQVAGLMTAMRNARRKSR